MAPQTPPPPASRFAPGPPAGRTPANPQSRPAPAAGALKLTPAAAKNQGMRIGIYGTGGIGKTSIALSAPGRSAIVDLDESLAELGKSMDLSRAVTVDGIATWAALRGALQAPGWDGIDWIILDTLTRAEEMAVEHTLQTVPHEKGNAIKRIEDYGFGKGYRHIYDTFLCLLSDLDQHVRQGRNVILIMHDTTATVPNPSGEDWLRYEPRLQTAKKEADIRARVREWLDHLLFIGHDVLVDKDGKGKGSGTRTIYVNEAPHCMAKSRRLDENMPYWKGDTRLWDLLTAE